MESHMDLQRETIVEILPGRFTFWATNSAPVGCTREAEAGGYHFFDLDARFYYEPFASDFGPLKLSMIYRYCLKVQEKITSPALVHMNLVHYCSTDANHMANVACLTCMYLVIVHGVRAEDAFKPFSDAGVEFKPFCDASGRRSTFDLTILDCLRSMEKAIELNWFDWRTFDVNTYECYDMFDHYGVNWIIPNKLMAFAGPGSSTVDSNGDRMFVPHDYVRMFHEEDVELVIRLNSKEYDEHEFKSHGIDHLDLFFQDGSCPSPQIISSFMDAVENTSGAVAVHCKAGLGRTGTLIALYAMKHYGFPAKEFIAWSRICRPGCILGPQQHFLVDAEAMFLPGFVSEVSGIVHELGGEDGQGERLCCAKRSTRFNGSIGEALPFKQGIGCLPSLLQRGKEHEGTPCIDKSKDSQDPKGGVIGERLIFVI
eukprot:TRINITY_DN15095_c0_g1_i1.p1 TRINITY_DN15095_c0_g1~~TRINITY_DN15095_c0_g1_i1.p1  ORF type:complete len:427 (+),score=62.39 TRINITY_DN15095_c0_g1_i1:60-1340(+)